MQINEVIQYVDLSKRAVKYYEEQGLLQVAKDSNGYRNYSEDNVKTLKEISVYRKLGIGIHDIKTLLHSEDKQLLKDIYLKKASELNDSRKELEALEAFIQDPDVDRIYEAIDYQTAAQALQDMVPGFYGYYFMDHFMPYLQITITTSQQREAYQKIVAFWDNTTLKIPLFMKLVSYVMYLIMPKPTMAQMTAKMDAQLKKYLNPSEEEYQKLKEMIRRNVKLKNSFLYRFHPAFIAQRAFMKSLRDQGYYDIFIPNMKELSPDYKKYQDALVAVNDRICKDLNLYYDSNFNLVMKDTGR